jgi:hypothetical protein
VSLVSLVGLLVALAGACGGNAAGCPDGWSKTCLADGTTCLCAPPCGSTQASCEQFELCGANGTCMPCVGPQMATATASSCHPDSSVQGCQGAVGWSCTSSDTPSDNPANMVACSSGVGVPGKTEYCCSHFAPLTYACLCAGGLCLPSSWRAGEALSIQPLSGASDAGTTTVSDAALAPPNR